MAGLIDIVFEKSVELLFSLETVGGFLDAVSDWGSFITTSFIGAVRGVEIRWGSETEWESFSLLLIWFSKVVFFRASTFFLLKGRSIMAFFFQPFGCP